MIQWYSFLRWKKIRDFLSCHIAICAIQSNFRQRSMLIHVDPRGELDHEIFGTSKNPRLRHAGWRGSNAGDKKCDKNDAGRFVRHLLLEHVSLCILWHPVRSRCSLCWIFFVQRSKIWSVLWLVVEWKKRPSDCNDPCLRTMIPNGFVANMWAQEGQNRCVENWRHLEGFTHLSTGWADYWSHIDCSDFTLDISHISLI